MELSKRIVTETPLNELWTSEKVLDSKRVAYLTKEEIRQILKIEPIIFVVAIGGEPLRWVSPKDCYSFWKDEAQIHIADNVDRIYLDTFPDEYCYLASRWSSTEQSPIILLEQSH